MMTCEELIAAAQAAGFEGIGLLDPQKLVLKQEVRDMCAVNTCRQYGRKWSCPPGCGELDACRQQVSTCMGGVLVQSVGEIEDSFDFEGMQELEHLHKERFASLHRVLLAAGLRVLALGAGCCTRCSSCTYPDAPCRFPEEMVSSMEAYGFVVSEVCTGAGIPYYYGPGKMAYSSCFLILPQVNT